jgi:hypothetical protein
MKGAPSTRITSLNITLSEWVLYLVLYDDPERFT